VNRWNNTQYIQHFTILLYMIGNMYCRRDVTDLDIDFRQALLQRLCISESRDLQSLMATSANEKLQNMEELIDEYIRFMRLMQLNPSYRLSPSVMVDHVWHEHILFTKEYRLFCSRHFGSYVDHVPTVEGYSKASMVDDQRSYATTLHLYASHFSSVPSPKYWPMDSKLKDIMNELSSHDNTPVDMHSFSIVTFLTLSILDCLSNEYLLHQQSSELPGKTSPQSSVQDDMYVSACGSSCGNTFIRRW